jgi:hypothetical protein|tara:strand:+ start:567 stop:794 length:228 start_codon:yes stop_codon:yes gene_type:complete
LKKLSNEVFQPIPWATKMSSLFVDSIIILVFGSLMAFFYKDEFGVLENVQEGKITAMRDWKFKSEEAIEAKNVLL